MLRSHRAVLRALGAAGTVAFVLSLAATMRTAPGAHAGILPKAQVALKLHGSTPTMAWSPDGKRLAVASGYEYFGWDNELSATKSTLGVYVIEASNGKQQRYGSEQGFHPLWLGPTQLAWGKSEYEDGTPGVYVATIGRPAAKRVGKLKGVFHTLPAKNGQVLLYSGWPEYKRWVYVHPKSGAVTAVAADHPQDSWTKPAKLIHDQCPQSVGKAAVSVSESAGVELTTGKGKTTKLAPKPYVFKNYGRDSCDAPAQHCGPVAACLAPDGKHVAFVTPAGRGQFELHIQRVPE